MGMLSSANQDVKTKQEKLNEYEKDYLARLEKEKSGNLQNVIFEMTQEMKELGKKDYVGICVVCTKGVDREEMIYQKNRLFHPDCYDKHGQDFPEVDQEARNQTLRAQVEITQLKNLKERFEGFLNSEEKSQTKSKSKSSSKNKKKRRSRKTPRRKISSKRRVKKKASKKHSKKKKISGRKKRSKRATKKLRLKTKRKSKTYRKKNSRKKRSRKR